MFKRIVSFVLTVFLLITPAFASEEAIEAPKMQNFRDMASPETYTNGLGITEDQYEELKDTVYSATRACENSVDLRPFGILYSYSAMDLLTYFVCKGDPESFHVSNCSFATNYVNGRRIFVRVNIAYYYTQAQYNEMYDATIAEANKMLDGIEGNDSLSDVQKALLLHDRIAIHCEYDTENLARVNAHEIDDLPFDDYTMYGALINRICVCEGYCKTYSYLLDRIGIENYFCSSVSLGHIWNIIVIDGERYHVDVTFDDQTYDVSGRVMHTFFLCSSEKMYANSHGTTDYDTTPTSTLYDDAFWNDSETQFVLLNDEIFYISKPDKTFNKWVGDDQTELFTINARWRALSGGYYTSNFSRMSGDSRYVYYTTYDTVVRYDPLAGMTSTMYEYVQDPDLTGYYGIYGMRTEDGVLYIEPNGSYAFAADTKANYAFSVEYELPSIKGDVNGDGSITAQDIRCIKKYLVEIKDGYEFIFYTADVYEDEVITAKDVRAIKQLLVS
ncbi:MAG: hypothetical protein IJT70_04240 [Clostridia bacterium]|nr:hypothetical protein [Clostridia bacterium]